MRNLDVVVDDDDVKIMLCVDTFWLLLLMTGWIDVGKRVTTGDGDIGITDDVDDSSIFGDSENFG
jgi:hypothetical protein